MSIFVHAQGIKTVHAGGGGGVKKWQNSVHVVVECPLSTMREPDFLVENANMNQIASDIAKIFFIKYVDM